MPQPLPLPIHPTDLRGVGQLVIDGVIGVTDLVEHLHAGIAASITTPLADAPERTRGLTRQIYRSVRGITRLVGGGLDLALAPIGTHFGSRIGPPSRARDDLRAVLNGVLGDHLETTGNPLAIPMTLLLEGRPIAVESTPIEFDRAQPEIVVMLHGLCMHAGHWEKPSGPSLPARLGLHAGRNVLHLHYNSGRTIDANGRDLAAALDDLHRRWPVAIERIVLVGHSMGGLVARSAAHHGMASAQPWTGTLHHLVALGSPHHGAPLERAGHQVDRLLGGSRYTRPFNRLGGVRSAGIVDLRHGRIVTDIDRPILPEGTQLHLVAASRSKAGVHAPRGDGLVPVSSALAADFESGQITRRTIHGCGHLDLLQHPDAIDRVVDLLAR